MKHEVVISGVGVFSPIGNTVDDIKKSLFSGRSGVTRINDPHLKSNFPVPYSAVIDKKVFSSEDLSERFSEIAKKMTLQALASTTDSLEFDAIIIGSRDECGFLAGIEVKKNHRLDKKLINAMRPESTVESVCETLKTLGHKPPPEHQVICLLGACATSALTMGSAFHRMREGDWKRVLVIAIDIELHPLALSSYHLLGAMVTADIPPEKASAPFSVNRSGFVLGEAAVVLMLETREEAKKRRATLFGEIVGASNTSDAWHLTAGREDCKGVIRAMEMAIKDAGITKDQISYINAHGTSTPVGDRLECLAIKETFGEKAYKIPISALKSQVGHTRIASGMLSTIACCLMLNEQKIAPTLNYQAGDPDCNLDFVPNKVRDAELNYILINSFGFGGQNACIVLKKINRKVTNAS